MTYLGAAPGRHVQVGPRKEPIEPANNSCSTRQMTLEERKLYGLPVQNGEKVSPLAKLQFEGESELTRGIKRELTKAEVEEAIASTRNIYDAARKLKCGQAIIYRYMKQYGIKAKHEQGYNRFSKLKEGETVKDQGQAAEPVNVLADKLAEMTGNAGSGIDNQLTGGIDPAEKNESVQEESGGEVVTEDTLEPFGDILGIDEAKPAERGMYEVFGQNIGRLVDEKQKAYGRAFQKIAAISKIIYPSGVPVEKMNDYVLVVRMLDKICRIADGNKAAFGENPFADLVGYSLLGYVEVGVE